MSEQVAETSHTNAFTKVTPFSKYLAMTLFVALPFIGGYIGYTYAPVKVVEVEKMVEVEKVGESKVVSEVKKVSNEVNEIDTLTEYLLSNYRVVSVTENPYYSDESKYNNLVVVATRGVNDDSCGGMYGPPTCYIFLESNYYGIESPKFVGTWTSEGWSLRPETITFVSPTVINFNANVGDGGAYSKTVWELDLTTGSSTMISREDKSSE